jgi:hypothetical protein
MNLRPSKYAGEISECGYESITKNALPDSYLHTAVFGPSFILILLPSISVTTLNVGWR